MKDVPKEAEESIYQLQLMEQNIQNLRTQRQQFQSNLIEIDSAINELEKTDESYKIVGNIMVKSEKKPLQEELNSQKEITSLRIDSFEKQEKDLREKASKLQKEVMGQLKK
jgi:prefoldin beta subunit